MGTTGFGYRGLTAVGSKPAGGFCLIRVRSLLSVWLAFQRGEISLYMLRVWLACEEIVARRCQMDADRRPEYKFGEVLRLVTSGNERRVKAGIARLAAAGVLRWEPHNVSTATFAAEARLAGDEGWTDVLGLVANNQRRVPVPRRILRFLARSRSKTLIGTALGHLLRCLYYRKGRCISGGRCKTSWIAEALGLDPRNVKSARKTLMTLGWLVPVPCSQISLNRWGLEVVINLQWSDTASRSETPPLPVEKGSETPPLYGDHELYPRGSNYQKLSRAPGVRKDGPGQPPPCLRHVTFYDLRDPVRLATLYEQATQAGLVPETVASRLRWFAAAEHALAVGQRNPCGLFAAVWRRRLWHHITQADEDIARATLKLLDFGEETWLARRTPAGGPPEAAVAA